ncbi:MAG: lactonase family protein [Flavisolibacter sp.]
MLVGTYTSGTSKGIYVYDFNKKTGEVSLIDSIATPNPSYLTVSRDQHFVYAVNENENNGNGGTVTAFSFDNKTGHLAQLGQQTSKGDSPCYITLDQTGKWLLVGNYTSGSLSVLPVFQDGNIGGPVSTVADQGHSVNKQRQDRPHVHAAVLSPDNKLVFVPDLGIDKVMIYSFDPANGILAKSPQNFVQLKNGSGPRHFVFHPNGRWAYLSQELSGTASAFTYQKGKLQLSQTISSLPKDYHGSLTTADIHISPSGKFLYVSNRDQSNSIAIFRINPKTGLLKLLGFQSTLGKTPRNFNLDLSGNFLMVANQNSDNIVFFSVNPNTGLLTTKGNPIDLSKPVCIKWISE